MGNRFITFIWIFKVAVCYKEQYVHEVKLNSIYALILFSTFLMISLTPSFSQAFPSMRVYSLAKMTQSFFCFRGHYIEHGEQM